MVWISSACVIRYIQSETFWRCRRRPYYIACLFLLQFPSSLSSVLSLFDFDPEEIARQLTIIDFRLFAKIKPAELLNQVRCFFLHIIKKVGCDWEEVFQ